MLASGFWKARFVIAILLSIFHEAWVSLHEQLREVGASPGGYGAAQNSGMGNLEVRGRA